MSAVPPACRGVCALPPDSVSCAVGAGAWGAHPGKALVTSAICKASGLSFANAQQARSHRWRAGVARPEWGIVASRVGHVSARRPVEGPRGGGGVLSLSWELGRAAG